MAYSHGTPNSIVKDGLVFAVDPANIRSYPGSGTTVTDLIGTNNGTLVNSPQFNSDNAGIWTFDGNDEYIDFGTSLNFTSKISIGGWFKTSGTSNNTYIISKHITGLSQPYFVYGVYVDSSSKLVFRIGTSIAYLITSTTSIEDNAWHYFTGVYNGTNIKLYIDGASDATPVSATGTLDQTSKKTTIGVVISGDDGSINNEYDGKISLTHFYNHALSAQEVLQNYRALKGRFE